MQEVLKERKLAFKLMVDAVGSKLTCATLDTGGLIDAVSGIEQRIHEACIDAKGEARDQRMRHGVVYRQMVREALAQIGRNTGRITGRISDMSELADNVAAAVLQPLAFVDEDEVKRRQLQSVQQRMKTKVKCNKCGSAAVVFEKQERSSDEGATVYHQCVNPECKFLLRIA